MDSAGSIIPKSYRRQSHNETWDMFNTQPPITLAFLVPILNDKCSHMIM